MEQLVQPDQKPGVTVQELIRCLPQATRLLS